MTIKIKHWQKLALKELEDKAHKWAEDACSWEDVSEKTTEDRRKIITKQVEDILGFLPKGFFWNGDPRGYALKIDNETVVIPQGMATDWGGYGLLAHKDTHTV